MGNDYTKTWTLYLWSAKCCDLRQNSRNSVSKQIVYLTVTVDCTNWYRLPSMVCRKISLSNDSTSWGLCTVMEDVVWDNDQGNTEYAVTASGVNDLYIARYLCVHLYIARYLCVTCILPGTCVFTPTPSSTHYIVHYTVTMVIPALVLLLVALARYS